MPICSRAAIHNQGDVPSSGPRIRKSCTPKSVCRRVLSDVSPTASRAQNPFVLSPHRGPRRTYGEGLYKHKRNQFSSRPRVIWWSDSQGVSFVQTGRKRGGLPPPMETRKEANNGISGNGGIIVRQMNELSWCRLCFVWRYCYASRGSWFVVCEAADMFQFQPGQELSCLIV